MHQPSFDTSRFERPSLAIRTRKEDLIEQIVAATTEPNKAKLARALAIAGNTLRWTETDLHALLKKAHDATIRNYTAYVWWSCKITGKRS